MFKYGVMEGINLKILILHARVGNGHYKAAEVIRDKLAKKYPDSTIYFEDGLEESSRVVNFIAIKGYKNILKYVPEMFGSMYDRTDTTDKGAIEAGYRVINRYLTIRIKRMLRELEPDVIFSTHPFVTRMCAYLKKKGKTHAKLATLITDYAPHNMWVTDYSNIDKILVATEEVKDSCIKKYGVPESKLEVTGIPISDKFFEKMDKAKILEEFNLDENLPVFLFFPGGGLGVGNSTEILKELLKCDMQYQLVIIAGKNEKLKEEFEEIVKEDTRNIRVLGFTDKVPELMHIAEAVISKPGGLTSTECLISKKPMLIINAVPGQEEQNASYLCNNGAAIRVAEGELAACLTVLLNKPIRVKQMKDMCAILRRPNASEDIVDSLIELYNMGKEE